MNLYYLKDKNKDSLLKILQKNGELKENIEILITLYQ